MDILESSYFMYSNKFLRIFGLWPYQDARTKYTRRIYAALLLSSLLIPTVKHAKYYLRAWMCKVYELRHKISLVLLGMPSILYYVEFITKYMYLALKNHEMKRILDNIANDFRIQKSKKLDILHDYSKDARSFNNIYAAYLVTVVCMYNLSFWTPKVLDFLLPLNESRPDPVPRLLRYYVDTIDDSFNFPVLHGTIVDWYSMIFFIGFDTLLINCAQHACSLFTLVIHELEVCLNVSRNIEADDQKVLKLHEDKFYNEIVKVVDLHRHALEFSNRINVKIFIAMVNSMYTFVILCIIAVSLLAITLSEFQTVIYLKDTSLMIGFLFFSIGELVHILYYNWPGQRIHDHSLRIYQSCYNCEWFRDDISVRCKKLLKLMMVRSQASSHLTAGKLYILGYENFAKVLKASLSYFTVLLSMQ